ncbi:hypothetical protein Terro_4299 [Terriglobus roseus DSM 18391]|uniref:Uncharacterized protein n=1 Tax=Terriglobus roseus (strain DSM 18391 / NRRL B-41598 / KBS 63) TaxID=926566 RepID=I3ZMM8_TERRK|nr:hypothetical protein [Terriglobus roseus]AFL90496.1 hypothetical protein Terro_4299 [Terriglobus roseus DSM 18391]
MRSVEEPGLGGVAAAMVAAGAGSAAMGVFYVLGGMKSAYFNLYKPAGALSGVSTAAIVVWLVVWAVLAKRWKVRHIGMGTASAVALGLLVLGLLLTYPPVERLF